MKIALLGYGRMGKEIEKIALQRGHEIVILEMADRFNSVFIVDRTQLDFLWIAVGH